MNRLTSQIIIDIINTEMSMPKNSVWVREQNHNIPNDSCMYIVVGMVSAHTMGNNTYMETIDSAQYQVQIVQQSEDIQIDVFSRNNDSLTRSWEVIAALQSFYAQQQMELNNFKIMRIPQSFIDTSAAEGGSQLTRYTLIFNCMVWYRKQKLLNSTLGDYYNDFTTRVDTEQTIGTSTPVAQFEIKDTTPKPPYA